MKVFIIKNKAINRNGRYYSAGQPFIINEEALTDYFAENTDGVKKRFNELEVLEAQYHPDDLQEITETSDKVLYNKALELHGLEKIDTTKETENVKEAGSNEDNSLLGKLKRAN